MEQPFNSPELNAGFQLDASLLTPEQLEHALQVFQARGINQTSFKTKENNLLCYKPQFKTICWLSESNLPLIDYPTLCRGSVQLDSDTCALFSPEKLLELYNYANPLGLVRNYVEHGKSQYAIFVSIGNLFLGYAHVSYDNKKISPEEFEVKLKGIYPVVRETTETVEKPKYLKGIENECVVEFIEENIKGRFKGKIVEKGQQGLPVGYVYDCFFCDQYSPCDYTEQDTPVTEQPMETIADCGKKTLMDNPTIADHIGSHFNLAFDYAKGLVNENTRLRAQLYRLLILEQENAQLKELNQSLAERNIYTIDNQAQQIADLQKQVEQLTQQVLDLNRLGANLERENKQLVSDLSAANQRIAAQSQVINNEPKEPVYDSNWLDSVVMEYANKKYALFGDNHIVAVANLGSWAELDPKTSATIIVAALAKHLNPMFKADKNGMWCIAQSQQSENYKTFQFTNYNASDSLFNSQPAAQKAISILTEHFPQVLKNYLG